MILFNGLRPARRCAGGGGDGDHGGGGGGGGGGVWVIRHQGVLEKEKKNEKTPSHERLKLS